MDKSVSGLILAAGFSSRMGGMKALLPFGGMTIVERLVRCFYISGIQDVCVVTGFEAERVQKALTGFPVKFIYNEMYEKGMYTSVQAGMKVAKQGNPSGVLLLPVDCPLTSPFTLERLAGRFNESDCDVYYPSFQNKKGHPPLISARLIDEILSDDGKDGLRGVLAKHEAAAEYVVMGNPTCLIDIDTRRDYENALRYLETRKAPDIDECRYIYDLFHVPGDTAAHCAAVAKAAEALSRALKERGYETDPGLVSACGILHDMQKGKRDHAGAAAEIVRKMGYEKAAEIIGNHMDIAPEYAGRICDESILYFADKIVKGGEVVPLDIRFSYSCANPDTQPFAQKRLAAAKRIQEMIEEALGTDAVRFLKSFALRANMEY